MTDGIGFNKHWGEWEWEWERGEWGGSLSSRITVMGDDWNKRSKAM
jgi:hypothetical protein